MAAEVLLQGDRDGLVLSSEEYVIMDQWINGLSVQSQLLKFTVFFF